MILAKISLYLPALFIHEQTYEADCVGKQRNKYDHAGDVKLNLPPDSLHIEDNDINSAILSRR